MRRGIRRITKEMILLGIGVPLALVAAVVSKMAEAIGISALQLVLAVIGLVFVGIVLAAWGSIKDAKKRKESQAKLVRGIAKKYERVLAKKRTQLLVKDDYGDIDDAKWVRELQYFFDSKIKDELLEICKGTSEDNIGGEEITDIIDEVASKYQERNQELYEFDQSMTGLEYEQYCAERLRSCGWDTSVSKASNDQGIDIIAKKDGKKLAIQCKKYSKAVGNRAVQEAISGSMHFRADQAVVVSNSIYTRSAKQLARSSNTLLIHHSELKDLWNLVNT